MSVKSPFFILGSPRSGTTILRNILRIHPGLECPEETHYYRFAEVFGCEEYLRIFRTSPVLKRHRELDGVSEEAFEKLLRECPTRKALQVRYVAAFLKAKGSPDARWFDKTPQNTGNILRIVADFPKAKIVHMHRNPLNVIASLMEGGALHKHSFRAALNVWLEAVQSAVMIKRLMPGRIRHVGLESLIEDPGGTMGELCEFLGIEDFPEIPPGVLLDPPHRFEAMPDSQINAVIRHGKPYMKALGYPTTIEGYKELLGDS